MKIFILDKFKITKFKLPEKIEDSFLIPYKGYRNKNDLFVTVEANENKWQLKSNGIINVMDDSNLFDFVEINDYDCYCLNVLGQEEQVVLYALPTRETETYNLQFQNLTSITIGSSANCNIFYENNLTAELHAEIKNINNEWYIAVNEDDSYRTYVNGERILTAKLKVGDVIFINGLKIIWMKDFLKINNPKQMISVNGANAYEKINEVDNTKYSPVSEEESNIELYSEDDYFYHMPRVVPVINPEEIIIDPPPGGEIREELPFLLTLGTSLTLLG